MCILKASSVAVYTWNFNESAETGGGETKSENMSAHVGLSCDFKGLPLQKYAKDTEGCLH